jgi:hypothetical protein
MIYDKNTQILIIIFIINHKKTINIVYLVTSLVAVVANKRFVKIFTHPPPPPLSCNPRGVFANLRVIFSFQVQLMFLIFRLGLFYNKVLLDTVIQYIRRRSAIYRAEKR